VATGRHGAVPHRRKVLRVRFVAIPSTCKFLCREIVSAEYGIRRFHPTIRIGDEARLQNYRVRDPLPRVVVCPCRGGPADLVLIAALVWRSKEQDPAPHGRHAFVACPDLSLPS